jgi:hypothetical protein
MGTFVLDRILSGQPSDEVVMAIQTYLEEMGKRIKDNQIALQMFIITKVRSRVCWCTLTCVRPLAVDLEGAQPLP